MNLRPLIDPGFWFDLTPVRMVPVFEASFFVLFAALVIGGAVIRIYLRNRPQEKYVAILWRRIAKIASISGVLGFVILFFAFEEVQVFGSRFWFLVWAVGVTYAAVSLARFMKHQVPQLRLREQSRAEVNKYLPRRSR